MNPYVALAIAAAAVGAIWYAWDAGVNSGKAQCEAAASREERLVLKAADGAASAAAAVIQDLKVRYVPIKQEAERIVTEVPVYRDCRHDPDGMRVLNDALAGRKAASEPAGGSQLSAPAATVE